MKVLIAILTLNFFFVNIIWGQTPRRYSPSEMRQDVDSLIKYLIEAHPNPFYRYPKASFFKDVFRVKSHLNRNLDKMDFYLRIAPLLGKLDDGHTDIHIMQFYDSLNPIILPYNVKLSTKRPFINCLGPYKGIKTALPTGAEIISINNISAQKIVNDIIDLNTGESRLFRAEFGATRFYFYLEALYKANGLYHVKYKHNGIVKDITLKGIRKNILDELAKNQADGNVHSDPVYSLRLLNNNQTAVIDFKSFEWDGFKAFTDSAFTVIKERHVQNLIINLIDNSGGDSDVGDAFFQYILNKPFTQYAKVLEKNSALLKQRLLEHRLGKPLDSADKALLAKPNGSLDTEYVDKINIGDNPLRFNGRVIVLVNIETYSSASDFAQCFKYYKRGIVIGEETGGLIKSYGDIVTAHLPHSGLALTVSSKLYYNIGANENDWRGVIPDIYSSPDQALQRALKYIDGKK
ncbi:S41 family peptidase [Mucilaginibacter sp. RS28]|uniref:S41 family peptidase n=1 Tax=Mucilaginibacter straminoryzae TaxID=2932774 RepID=A0A9X1X1N0_9SPHI|nr:S41 family peptidase [Mucilaginibacter straminoryzae]MCJ8209602.1 S41 family peptidase [Mucilaginibacter straminoryzae]